MFEDWITKMRASGRKPFGTAYELFAREAWNAATAAEREARADEIEQLRKSLKRCLEEAETWLDDTHGCKPKDVVDYDGWADEARRILGRKL